MVIATRNCSPIFGGMNLDLANAFCGNGEYRFNCAILKIKNRHFSITCAYQQIVLPLLKGVNCFWELKWRSEYFIFFKVNKVQNALKRTFSPEFLNRIDETIMFHPLTRDNVKDIARIQLEILVKRLNKNGINLDFTEEALNWLAQIGYDPQFGARPIKRVIQKKVMNELSKEILSGNVTVEDKIIIDNFEGEIVFRKG